MLYIYPIYQSLIMVLKFLFTKCPYVIFTTSKNILLEFTINKVRKFVVFKNVERTLFPYLPNQN